jgi:hypothetical protein
MSVPMEKGRGKGRIRGLNGIISGEMATKCSVMTTVTNSLDPERRSSARGGKV